MKKVYKEMKKQEIDKICNVKIKTFLGQKKLIKRLYLAYISLIIGGSSGGTRIRPFYKLTMMDENPTIKLGLKFITTLMTNFSIIFYGTALKKKM